MTYKDEWLPVWPGQGLLRVSDLLLEPPHYLILRSSPLGRWQKCKQLHGVPGFQSRLTIIGCWQIPCRSRAGEADAQFSAHALLEPAREQKCFRARSSPSRQRGLFVCHLICSPHQEQTPEAGLLCYPTGWEEAVPRSRRENSRLDKAINKEPAT